MLQCEKPEDMEEGLQGVGEEHLRRFPTLRDPRIHIVLSGRPMGSAVLRKTQRVYLGKRAEDLRQDAMLEESLRQWWEWLPRPKSWLVEWGQFRDLNILLYEELCPGLCHKYHGLPETAAAVDWHLGRQGEPVMNNTLFAESMLQLADNFTPSADPADLSQFLDDILAIMQRRYSGGTELHAHVEQLRSSSAMASSRQLAEMLLPDERQFEWPSAGLPKQTKKAHDAFLFGKDVRRSSFGSLHPGKKRKGPLKTWDGKKYEAWEDHLQHHGAVELNHANSGMVGRLSTHLRPCPQTAAPTVPIRGELPQPYQISLGQAEAAIKYCSEDPEEINEVSEYTQAETQIELEMLSELTNQNSRTGLGFFPNRPYSSQHRRTKKEDSDEAKIRPASSHASIRNVDRPISAAVRRRQIGGGGFVAGDVNSRTEYGRVGGRPSSSHQPLGASGRPQSALLIAPRPHSAMQMQQSPLAFGGWDVDEKVQAPHRNRPSTSLGHRPVASLRRLSTLGEKKSVKSSQPMSDSRRSWLRNVDLKEDVRGETLESSRSSIGSGVFDLQHLAPAVSRGDEVASEVGVVYEGSLGSLRSLIRPISANISVRVERSTRISSRVRQNVSSPGKLVSVKPLSPVGADISADKVAVSPNFSGSIKEQRNSSAITDSRREDQDEETRSRSPTDDLVTARHIVRTYAEHTIYQRSTQAASPQNSPKNRISCLTNLDDLDQDSIDSLRIIYAQGAEVPPPQEPSKQDIRPFDNGSQAELQLGDVLAVRKVWGKNDHSKNSTVKISVSQDPVAAAAVSSPTPDSPYMPSYQPQKKLSDLRSKLSDLRSRPTSNILYPITPVQYQWEPHFVLLPGDAHSSNRPTLFPAASRVARPARGGRERGRVKFGIPLGYGPVGYAAVRQQFSGASPHTEKYLSADDIEAAAKQLGNRKLQESIEEQEHDCMQDVGARTNHEGAGTLDDQRVIRPELSQISWSTIDST